MTRADTWGRLVRTLIVVGGLVALALWVRSELLKQVPPPPGLPPGRPAPDIAGLVVQAGQPDRPLRLSDFRGKVVVVSFWATWCGPCRVYFPDERALAKQMEGRPFAFLGVSLDEDDRRDEMRKFLEAQGLPWPNWVDGRGGPISRDWLVDRIPATFIVDPRGMIRTSGLHGKELTEAVEKLLRELEGG